MEKASRLMSEEHVVCKSGSGRKKVRVSCLRRGTSSSGGWNLAGILQNFIERGADVGTGPEWREARR